MGAEADPTAIVEELSTPRARTLAALAGREVYPVPWDVIENLVHPKLAASLARQFGFAETDHESLLQALGVHTRWAKPAYVGPPLAVAAVQPPDPWPNRVATRSIWGSWSGMNTYSDTIPRPLAGIGSVGDLGAHPWPDPDWFDYARLGWQAEAQDYRPVSAWAADNASYLRIVGGFEPVFSRVLDLVGMEEGLVMMATRPDLLHALVGHIGDFLEAYYRRIATACQGHVDVLAFGDDFAGQRGLLINPKRWRTYFLPLWRRLFAIPHAYGMRASLHSCGGVRAVLGDLIDAGLDVLEVVQIGAAGMEPEGLKREFGADLVFYGGMDVQRLLPFGEPQEIRLAVRHLADVLGKGGGFILANAHLLQPDVPLENVVAMYHEAREYRASEKLP